MKKTHHYEFYIADENGEPLHGYVKGATSRIGKAKRKICEALGVDINTAKYVHVIKLNAPPPRTKENKKTELKADI